MRVVDAMMAIPNLLFALLIVTVLGPSGINAVVAIGIAFAPGMARVARSVTLAVRNQDYVAAAIARGESSLYIMSREVLPNMVAPVIVEATIRVAFSIMLLATLSYLGLGAQPPAPEWGLMISEARGFMFRSFWTILWPGLAIATVAITFNLLGDGLRDVLNPRTH
jgi:peptide/nickel transport system permease protein